MTDAPEWPTYPVGPKDSLFALGVASSEFAQLEGALQFIFALVYGIHFLDGIKIASKIGNEASIELIKIKLPGRDDWSQQTRDAVTYFLEGFSICLENRNRLMHSSFADNENILYKLTKKGRFQQATPTLPELHQVADDMKAFLTFGVTLRNAIVTALSRSTASPNADVPWPDRPPLPRSMSYS